MSKLFVLILLFSSCVQAQTKDYKDYDICTDSVQHKGKVNHGKYYCVGSMTIREYKNGKKDTLWRIWSGGKLFISDEYKQYQNLSERGKYIVDSLKEDGITQYQNEYLSYEPAYMKDGKKIVQLWKIQGQDVVVMQYKLWHTKNSFGSELVNTIKTK